MPEEKNKDIEENKVIAAIGYIGILCLVPLLAKKDSKFCQFHGKQGLVLVIAWLIIFFVGIVPIIGWIISFFGTILLLVLSILGLVKALSGEYWELPLLSQYAKKLNL